MKRQRHALLMRALLSFVIPIKPTLQTCHVTQNVISAGHHVDQYKLMKVLK